MKKRPKKKPLPVKKAGSAKTKKTTRPPRRASRRPKTALEREIAKLPRIADEADEQSSADDAMRAEARAMARKLAEHFSEEARDGTANGWELAMLFELVTGQRASATYRATWRANEDLELQELVSGLRFLAHQRTTNFARQMQAISGALLDPALREKMAKFALPDERHRLLRGKGRFEHLRAEMLDAADRAIAMLKKGAEMRVVAHATALAIFPFVEQRVPDEAVADAIQKNRSDRESLAVALLELSPQWRGGKGYDAILNASQKKKSSRS